MGKYIKVSHHKSHDPIYIRKKWIVTVYRDARNFTVIVMGKGDMERYWVTETPEDIMRMMEDDEQ